MGKRTFEDMKIVIDKIVPYLAEALVPYAEVVYVDGRNISKEVLKDADGLIVRTRTQCNETLLGGARKLRFVGTATIGYDHIDREWLASQGIAFTSAAGCNARAVLQWVAASLAHLAKRGNWSPQERTLGMIVGGPVGSIVADYARSWGFRVLCSDPPREQAEGLGREEGFVPLDELLSQSDIVTLHTPLSHTGAHPTFHLANHDFLAQLHNGATLLNASRGEVSDTSALLAHAHRLTTLESCRDCHSSHRRLLRTGQGQRFGNSVASNGLHAELRGVERLVSRGCSPFSSLPHQLGRYVCTNRRSLSPQRGEPKDENSPRRF